MGPPSTDPTLTPAGVSANLCSGRQEVEDLNDWLGGSPAEDHVQRILAIESLELKRVRELCPAEAALSYAQAGTPIFPVHGVVDGHCTCRDQACDRPGKHPRTPNGFKVAVTDLNQVQQWWERWP